MKRGRKAKNKDDGSQIPLTPPAILTTLAEKKAYLSLRESTARLGTSRASDLETICVAAKRMARLQMLYKKLETVVESDQLIVGVTNKASVKNDNKE
jgi:hypothetical protein